MSKKYKVLLIGDSCIDEYHYGNVERLSPEAPVPVLKITRSINKHGMAANVKDNLEAFGIDVDFYTCSARSVKIRYIDERSKQHIVRVDQDKVSPPFNASIDSLALIQYDAVVISDYDKGFINYTNVQDIKSSFRGPIFIDTKKRDLRKFEGCFVKVNSHEFSMATTIPDKIIVTKGDQGAEYNNINFPSPKVEVVDVCGAGDTFLSAMVYEYLRTGDIHKSIKYANLASAISVQHSGVYSLSAADIEQIDIDRNK